MGHAPVPVGMDGESQSHPGGADGFEQGSIVADPRQRRILAILRRQGEPIPTVELGTRLAASDESAAAAEQVELDLRHRCLPKLESVGWVERRPAGVGGRRRGRRTRPGRPTCTRPVRPRRGRQPSRRRRCSLRRSQRRRAGQRRRQRRARPGPAAGSRRVTWAACRAPRGRSTGRRPRATRPCC